MQPVSVRASDPGDLPRITAIYAWQVLHGTGTFGAGCTAWGARQMLAVIGDSANEGNSTPPKDNT